MKRKRLRELLNAPGIIRAPGAFDAWSARLVEMAGFPAVYMTGYGASASVIGKPDIGLMTMSEMAIQAGNIASAVDIPLIADGDTGYGGVLNVMRTVHEFEKAGVAALQLEDQVFPKRCGHMEGKQLIPKEEMAAKIRAAAEARKSDDFVIIARTDARAVTGLEDAIARALAYADAGADVLFVEAPRTVTEMEEIFRAVKLPLIANMVEKGKTPLLPADELERIGYRIAIYPVSTLYAATKAMIKVLNLLKEEGSTENCLEDLVGFEEFNKLVGVETVRDLENKFL
ncbi:MAG: carboxyvinyl-carboxyphosphonate phosphorylmutase [Desulfobacteraceae bacterium]|nr:MAG: carboxyvinyl-carboxyphosphonate phosphorylmutase [Desulfobacteraceae bacterium]